VISLSISINRVLNKPRPLDALRRSLVNYVGFISIRSAQRAFFSSDRELFPSD
jgi:hypothetical protein